jgi:hypothetical protein
MRQKFEMAINKAAWARGLRDGSNFMDTPPYPDGTAEAESWRQGWVEGMLKGLLLPYFQTPEIRDILAEAHPDSEEAAWRRRLQQKWAKPSSVA